MNNYVSFYSDGCNNNSNNNTLLYTDTDIGQVTFDANAPEPQNNFFCSKLLIMKFL